MRQKTLVKLFHEFGKMNLFRKNFVHSVRKRPKTVFFWQTFTGLGERARRAGPFRPFSCRRRRRQRRRRRRCFNATYICGTAPRLRVTRTLVFGDFTTTKVSSVSLVQEVKLLQPKSAASKQTKKMLFKVRKKCAFCLLIGYSTNCSRLGTQHLLLNRSCLATLQLD